jgi:hypothetical protein
VVVVGVWLSQPARKGPEADSQPATDQVTSPATGESNRSSFFSRLPPRPPREALTNEGPGVEVSAADGSSAMTNWESKVDEILSSDGDAANKAKQMLDVFSRFPESGQVEVVRHLSNLLPDQEYGPMGQLLLEPELPADVLDALMADVLNRPNSLKLPLLLEVARSGQHPKAGEARETLGLLLEADYEEDWDKWQAAMEKWLKENPD